MALVCCAVVVLAFGWLHLVDSHGRLIEPPSRSSAWRYNFPTQPNYNDHELYCGGFSRQWQKNGGKCGICGDAWDLPQPRPNEAGGKYGSGLIVRKLVKNGPVKIKVELTANHAGFFEFRLCPNNNPKKTASDRCFDKYLLERMDGSGARYFPTPGRSEVFTMEYQLPKDLLCTQCILQWRYVAGNNWGMCKNGTGMLGCGPQEEFRACADIAILGDGEVTTFEDYPEQDIVPHSPDDADNEIDSDLHKKGEETEEDEEFRVGERVAAILCAFMLTSLVLLLALWLSYVGKKRIVAFCGGLAPPKVTYFTKFLKPQKGTSKPGIPSTDPYGTPSAAIHAALERGEKPPVAPSRSVKPPAIYHNGFTNATLTAPGSSAGGEPKRPSVAPPPPPSRPPRQRSPKRQTSLGADDERTTDAESSITVNGVALPD